MTKAMAIIFVLFGAILLLYNVAGIAFRYGYRSAKKDLMKKWYKEGYDDGFSDGVKKGEENGRKYYNIANDIFDHNSSILRKIKMNMERNGDWS